MKRKLLNIIILLLIIMQLAYIKEIETLLIKAIKLFVRLFFNIRKKVLSFDKFLMFNFNKLKNEIKFLLLKKKIILKQNVKKTDFIFLVLYTLDAKNLSLSVTENIISNVFDPEKKLKKQTIAFSNFIINKKDDLFFSINLRITEDINETFLLILIYTLNSLKINLMQSNVLYKNVQFLPLNSNELLLFGVFIKYKTSNFEEKVQELELVFSGTIESKEYQDFKKKVISESYRNYLELEETVNIDAIESIHINVQSIRVEE